MTEKLLFTEAEWNASMPQLVTAMTEYLLPYRISVSLPSRPDSVLAMPKPQRSVFGRSAVIA